MLKDESIVSGNGLRELTLNELDPVAGGFVVKTCTQVPKLVLVNGAYLYSNNQTSTVCWWQ
jgi:hypothetical protein